MMKPRNPSLIQLEYLYRMDINRKQKINAGSGLSYVVPEIKLDHRDIVICRRQNCFKIKVHVGR